MVKLLKLKTNNKLFSSLRFALRQNQQFYLLALAITLALLHLLLAWKLTAGELQSYRLLPSDILSFEVPFWATIILLVRRDRSRHSSNTSIWGNSLALLLLTWVVVRTVTISWLDVDFFIFSPFLIAICFGVLAVGWKEVRRYWHALLCLCFMLVPANTPYMSSWLHIEQLTTATSAFLLHYIGLKATYHDTLLTLPTGQVLVSHLCAGGPLTIILLKVSLLMAIAFPMSWARKLGLALSAVGIGFGLGCIRTAFLAVVVNNDKVFHYWHSSTGSQIFLSLGTVAFVLLCTLLIPTEELPSQVNETMPSTPTTRWRIPLLLSAWVGVVLASIYLLIVPAPSRRLLAGAANVRLDIQGLQQVGTKSLSKPTTLDVVPGFDGMLAGQQYRYMKNSRQLNVVMYYVVNTGSNQMDVWLEHLTGIKAENIQKNIRRDGTGYYVLTADGLQANLTGCINVRGGSTVTNTQFNQNRHDLRMNRIVPWLLGKDVLRDERCLWVQLSTSVNGTKEDEAYQILKSVWTDNYAAWQSHLAVRE